MTKEEAIKILHPISDEYCQMANIRMTQAEDDICEALDMAIEALRCSETPKSSEQNAETAQNTSSCAHENDLVFREAAIEALARMMPRSYTPDGSHPADEEIFRAQEVFADCIEALEILPTAQPEIIRCKDCKHRDKYGCCKYWKGLAMGDIPIATDDYDFCSYAKRI